MRFSTNISWHTVVTKAVTFEDSWSAALRS